MALSLQEKQIVEYGMKNGKSKQEVMSAITAFRTKTPTQTAQLTQPQEAQGPSFKERFVEKARDNFEAVDTLRQEFKEGKRGILDTGASMLGEFSGAAADLTGEIIGTGVKKITQASWDLMPQLEKDILSGVGNLLKSGVKAVGDIKLPGDYMTPKEQVKALATFVGMGYDDFKVKHPDIARYAEYGGNVVQLAMNAAILTGAANSAVKATRNIGASVMEDAKIVGDATRAAKEAIKRSGAKMAEEVKQIKSAVSHPGETIDKLKSKLIPPKSYEEVEKELFKVENNYAKTRKAIDFSKDANAASRSRVVKSGILDGSVDNNGLIRTKQAGGAVDQYREATILGKESVVKDNLIRLGEKVKLKQVEKALTDAVMKSNLEGADLKTALSHVKSEMAGYALKADAAGEIPLALLQDAKISTTSLINFATTPEVQATRKTIARALKEFIENNSSFNVKEVNDTLAPYYKDLEYLQSLDGLKVQGGKLGKYFAKITGNIVGGVAGSVGGPIGSATGAVVGGEVAGGIQGAALSNTLTGPGGTPIPKNEILEKAVESAKLPNLNAGAVSRAATNIVDKIDDFATNPGSFDLWRGENIANKGGLSFTDSKEWAKNFGKLSKINLEGANVKILTVGDAQEAVAQGMISEKEIYQSFFKKGFDAIATVDARNPKVMEVIVNPKFLK